MKSIYYLSSGKPSPVILDLCSKLNEKSKVKLIYLDRPDKSLELDTELVSFDLIKISVFFNKGLVFRILNFPLTVKKIFRILKKNYPDTIIIESYDMLLIAFFFKKKIKNIIFYCRDLISYQTEKSLSAFIFRKIERVLLSSVSQIVLTSPEFFNSYYKRYFKKFLLYENYPVKEISELKTPSDSIRISFIGIIRYIESLRSVIDAIDKLINQGYKIQLNFYGGGLKENIETISSLAQKNEFIKIRGPFHYSKEIDGIYSNTDISLAVYDNKNPNCKVAIPNKYYEAIMSKTFLFVSSGTYLEKISREMGIGIGFDPFNSSEVYLKIKGIIDQGCIKNIQTGNTLENIYWQNLKTINQILKL